MRIETVNRADVRDLLDRITVDPQRIFGALGPRRTALHARYTPTTPTGRGALAYMGDCSDLATRDRVRTSRTKIELQAAGTLRLQTCKRKTTNAAMKHWAPTRGGRLAFDPKKKGLYHVAGMYNDMQALARGGEWRPWCFIDLETVREIHITLKPADGGERVVIRVLDLE